MVSPLQEAVAAIVGLITEASTTRDLQKMLHFLYQLVDAIGRMDSQQAQRVAMDFSRAAQQSEVSAPE